VTPRSPSGSRGSRQSGRRSDKRSVGSAAWRTIPAVVWRLQPRRRPSGSGGTVEVIPPARRYNRRQERPLLGLPGSGGPLRWCPERPQGELTTMVRTTDLSRDLLFGLLALQTGLINQGQLVAAFHAWTQARNRPMAEILAEQGALSAGCLTLVEGLVIEHLRRHGNDPERSLAVIGVGRSTRG